MKNTIDAINDLLFVETPIEQADLLFVFGNDWLPTMERATDLWNQGYAKRILISGHSANKTRKESEAKRFMTRGLELGLPQEAFILEHNATNTKENFVLSLPLLDEAMGIKNIQSILFLCKAFHTRRVLMTAKKYLAGHVRCMFVPTQDERNISRVGWWKDCIARERVLAEVRRIAEYALKDDISID
jgi:uncharacterized SAM-binding protein YcdF (DUF218 family)